MNKDDVVTKMAEATGMTKAAAEAAFKAAMDGVAAALKAGEKVGLVGFGSFTVVQRDQRQGINPLTKQPMTIPARKALKFKASKELVLSLQ